MKTLTKHTRWMAGPLAAALLIAALAPAAYADHGRGKRYKPSKHKFKHLEQRYDGQRSYRGGGHSRSVYVVRRSNAGPAIAGFLGGLFLGATMAHAAPSGYYYDDPYCHQRFASLEIYRAHLHRHHHPRIVRVINVDSGDCVRTGHEHHGRWVVASQGYDRDSCCEHNDDWDDRNWDED